MESCLGWRCSVSATSSLLLFPFLLFFFFCSDLHCFDWFDWLISCLSLLSFSIFFFFCSELCCFDWLISSLLLLLFHFFLLLLFRIALFWLIWLFEWLISCFPVLSFSICVFSYSVIHLFRIALFWLIKETASAPPETLFSFLLILVVFVWWELNWIDSIRVKSENVLTLMMDDC